MIAVEILVVLTAIYMVQSAIMDIRERKVYSFLAIVLIIAWGIALITCGEMDIKQLIIYWLCHLIAVFIISYFKVWGDGDSYILMLFVNVYLYAIGNVTGIGAVIGELVSLIAALSVSILVGLLESKIRKVKYKKDYKAAVVPGFAVVLIVLSVVIKGRWMSFV